ncbi:hypothetical protein EDC30_107162 [Paucimonas lemoignei]|uniref:DUF2267 domain-containing protein n=1 Tax=Paucimonas lemoignei TaxID=29443 RepID=A0A4R3HW68_PAULE|nr:hypothetical protein [Paucimonas lemoignei]TCS36345.1 hypothetical protein EDC30_107162 [Paucimonas lemoignei]
MNEIIQRLVAKTGLPEDKAAMAVDTVVGFLKEKLPGPVASQIDSLVGGQSGGSGGMGGLGDMASNLGGMFGKKE